MNRYVYKMKEQDIPARILKDHLVAYISFSKVPGTVRYWLKNSPAIATYTRAGTIAVPDVVGGANVTFQANDPPFTHRHGEYNRGMWINSNAATPDHLTIPLDSSLVRPDQGSFICTGWYPTFNMEDTINPKVQFGIIEPVGGVSVVCAQAKNGPVFILSTGNHLLQGAVQVVTNVSTPIYNRVNIGGHYAAGNVGFYRDGAQIFTGATFAVGPSDPIGYSLFVGNFFNTGLDTKGIFTGDIAWYNTILPQTLIERMTRLPY